MSRPVGVLNLRDKADLALRRSRREEFEYADLKCLFILIRRERERAFVHLHFDDLAVLLAQVIIEGDGIGRLIGVPDHHARADALLIDEIGEQPFHHDPADRFQLLVGEPYRLDAGNLDGCARRLRLRRAFLFVNDDVLVQTHPERAIT